MNQTTNLTELTDKTIQENRDSAKDAKTKNYRRVQKELVMLQWHAHEWWWICNATGGW